MESPGTLLQRGRLGDDPFPDVRHGVPQDAWLPYQALFWKGVSMGKLWSFLGIVYEVSGNHEQHLGLMDSDRAPTSDSHWRPLRKEPERLNGSLANWQSDN